MENKKTNQQPKATPEQVKIAFKKILAHQREQEIKLDENGYVIVSKKGRTPLSRRKL